jgi:hypothetical protein
VSASARAKTMRILAAKVLLGLVLSFCVAYIADYLQFQYRVRHNRQPYGTVTIQTTYAIAEKAPRGAQKTEYASGGTQDQACINALFPQSGHSPCWYLRRNAQKLVNF